MKTQAILLVEDETDDIFFMRTAMKAAGLEDKLHVVENGQHAVEYLAGRGEYANRELHPLPDIILLDLKLPGLMGMDVLRTVRANPAFELVVVIILTSSRLEADIRAAYRAGANSYLVKPNRPQELLHIVELIGQYWLRLNHPTLDAGTHVTRPRSQYAL